MGVKNKADRTHKRWMVLYGVGNTGHDLIYEFFKNFQNFFLTELCGISVGVTAAVTVTVNIIKAIITPISGAIVDNNPFNAKNKYIPWIRYMPMLFCALFILMSYLAWKGASTVVIIIIFSLFFLTPIIEQNALRGSVSAMARNREEASFGSSIIQVFASIGRMLTGIIVPVIMVKMSANHSTEDAQGFFWAVVVSCAIALVLFYISSVAVMKATRPDQINLGRGSKKSDGSILTMLKRVFTDKNVMVLFIIAAAVCFRTFVVAPIAPYYFKYVAGSMLKYAGYATATNIAGIAAPLCVPILLATVIKDPRRLLQVSLVCMLACHMSLLIGGKQTMWFVVSMSFCQFFYNMCCTLIISLFVDATDVKELADRKKGQTQFASGTGMSMYMFAVMFAQVLGSYIRNFALANAGYAGASTTVTPDLISGMVKLFAWWPSAFILIAIIGVSFCKLTPNYMKKVHEELDPLREAAKKMA